MKTVLLTGFEPFGGERVNPSALAVTQLDGQILDGHLVVAKILPVTFADALPALLAHARASTPSAILCVGEAGGRDEINVERVALNLDDARIPDNAGARPRDRAIDAAGPVAYWSTLPVARIVAAIADAGIPVVASNTAGTFVCNHVFYGLMRFGEVPAGFIHVPYTLEQGVAHGRPGLAVEDVARALAIAIRVTVAHPRVPD